MTRRLGLVLLSLWTVGALVVAYVIFDDPDLSWAGKPKQFVRWEPSELTVSIAPGETRALATTATVLRKIKKGQVTVSPELMPYLSLQSTTLERKLRKGTVVPLNVLVKVPTGAASAEVRGTIEVTRPKPRGQRKHLLDPLVLTLSIRAPSRLDYPEAGYSIEVPPGYEPATTTYRILEQTVHELTLVDPNDPDDALRVTSSNLLAPLSSVEEVWVDDPRSTIRSRSIVNVGSHKTLRVESAGEGGTFVEFHILSGDSIFTVTGPLQNAGLIEQLAGTLTFAG